MVKIDIRWNDIDANRHLANSAFMNYMSHARLSFMKKAGIGQKELEKHNIGPVAFYENIYYFKEVSPDETLYISVELKGLSEDGGFFEFMHNMYNEKGEHKASCEMMGAWIDMKARKLTTLPDSLKNSFIHFDKAIDYRTLTKEDTRTQGIYPKNIQPETLLSKKKEFDHKSSFIFEGKDNLN